MGQSGQLFFMSLTGNSIPIKFTPFGRIQKEQDRVELMSSSDIQILRREITIIKIKYEIKRRERTNNKG